MKVFNLLTACAIAAPLLFVSCSDDSIDNIEVPAVSDGPVTFSLGMGVVTQAPQASRALAHESGFDYENDIKDAVVIIYDTPLNASGGEIVYKTFISQSELKKDDNFTESPITAQSFDASGNPTTWSTVFKAENRYKYEFGAELQNGTYYILALANVGNLQIGSLNELRNYVYRGAICSREANPEDCSYFAMAAIGEQKFTFNKDNLSNNEYKLPDLYVQRLAARIDLVFGKRGYSKEDLANNDVDYVMLNNAGDYPFNTYQTSVYFPIYDAEKGNRISGAVFALDKLSIINARNTDGGEYLFERNDVNGTSIFGTENFNTDYATNFVKSPDFNGSPFTDFPELPANSGFMGVSGRVHTTSGNTEYAILGYVRENTFESYSDQNKYTGVSFTGHSNLTDGHFEGASSDTYDDNKYVVVSGTIPVRHSTGTLDTSRPLAYGIVRNTIYRIKIRFYAKGETIFARYYYYGSAFDGKEENKDGLGENEYTDIPFYNFILEGDGKIPND